MILENFIVFEGIDGAGTTTQLNVLRERAECQNFLFTAEPSPAPTGKFLRQVLKGEIKAKNDTIAYLFAADRCNHLSGALETAENRTLISGIIEACNSGKIVVSDRYLFSSLAYQSIGCDPVIPRVANSLFPLPQLVFYFDIDAESALKRVGSRGEQKEIFEKQDFLEKTVIEYKKAIREYEEPAKNQGMKIVWIDAKLTKEEISKIIWGEIEKLPIIKM